jgi:hypothetical protein
MNDYWKAAKYITLPVRLVNGQWELAYGGGTGIREGAFAELRTAISNIEDEEVKARLTQTVAVPVLSMGTRLLIALSVASEARTGTATHYKETPVLDVPLGCTRFAEVTIGDPSPQTKCIDDDAGGLWIRQRGVDKTELVCSCVVMPSGFDPAEASSLNHACTLLSEKYETHRISHTKNVYQYVFYLDEVRMRRADGATVQWQPLENLRRGVIGDVESDIVSKAWQQLERELGFRPITLEPARRAKRKG